jgi:hypothetical protein
MATSVDIFEARVLEIGGSYFKLEYPERTTSLWSAPRMPQEGSQSTASPRPTASYVNSEAATTT